MSNKIWNFDILVDDCFVNFNTKKQEISAKIDCLLINNTGSGGKYRRLWQYEENEEM